ncbi:MAG: carbonic anhydrase [Patescibacteria group bacterium]
MSQANETFFTSVGCMDGRVQKPIAGFGKNKFGAIYPDTITEAGKVGILAHSPSKSFLKSLKHKLNISIDKHYSRGIIVHGHEDCAGNPVEEKTHKEDVRKSVEIVKKLISNKVPVHGVFLKRGEPEWIVEEL